MAKDPPPRHGQNDDDSHRRRDFTVWFIVAALIGLWLVQIGFDLANPTQTVPYSRFDQWVAENKVSEVTIGPDLIEGRLRAPSANEPARFVTVRVDPALAESLAARGVTVTGARPNGIMTAIVSWVLPAFLFYLVWSFLFRRVGQGLGGALSMGKSRAKLFVETDVKVSFADVAGVDEAKHELEEVVGFLKDPAGYGRLGAHAPKGVLLVGPPGTGKTLLARAVAGEARVPFFSISGSEFVEMFVGVGAARVRDLFEQARKAAPSIIFIDELDALGRSRSGVAIGGFDEKEQTLNQLLAEIDGFDTKAGVILLAATNRPEILDKALLRPGRFDRQVLVDRPDRTGRLAILKVHARKIRLESDLDLDAVAGMTTGFAGADLANLVNEAAIAATRRNGQAVTLQDFETAIERIVAGLEKKSRILNADERRRVAVHEMGHALVAANLPSVDPVQKVSIVPHGLGALGFTMQRPTDERFLLSRTELEERIAVLLGGRAAEALVYAGDISTGAADDLEHATQIALDMAMRFGMNPTLGERIYAQERDPFLLGAPTSAAASEATQREIDMAVRELLAQAHARAASILTANRSDLEAGVGLLLAKETLRPEEFAPLHRGNMPPCAETLPGGRDKERGSHQCETLSPPAGNG
ncbi:MAG: ATP-dependent zinc metalloprotease FtsH [Hyphomonadaceae bacterium]|nr:ATP-dependent zinc metalloprotease FtsH [Hyphomonadaceae bacterium]